MPHTWFSTIALTLIAVIALLAVGASVAVWRIRSIGLMATIWLVATAAILWVIFVWPVYVD